jgi:hypothetical protein
MVRIEETNMTLCPVAIVAGCRNCPVVKICPLKSVIGDYSEKQENTGDAGAKPPPADKSGA